MLIADECRQRLKGPCLQEMRRFHLALAALYWTAWGWAWACTSWSPAGAVRGLAAESHNWPLSAAMVGWILLVLPATVVLIAFSSSLKAIKK